MIAAELAPGVELGPLEPWQAEEFAAHLDRAREHIRPWVGPSFVTTDLAGARATLQRYADGAARDGIRILGIREHGALVGGVMLVEFSAASGTCELGCWLEPDAEGKGYISGACRELLRWVFEVRGLHRAEWRCRADNARSSAVAERLGMTLEGVLREAWLVNGDGPDEKTWHDKQVWSILAHEWTAPSRARHSRG